MTSWDSTLRILSRIFLALSLTLCLWHLKSSLHITKRGSRKRPVGKVGW